MEAALLTKANAKVPQPQRRSARTTKRILQRPLPLPLPLQILMSAMAP